MGINHKMINVLKKKARIKDEVVNVTDNRDEFRIKTKF